MIKDQKIYSIKIIGKVQGVHFRESTKGVADMLKIKGWIRNVDEGHVLMEVKGNESSMTDFLQWCEEGPDRAKVEKMECKEIEESNITFQPSVKHPFLNFDILK